MTDRQFLELRQSAIRGRLAELGAGDGDETARAEVDSLAAEYAANESRLRAYMVAEDAPVKQATARTERAELFQRASIGALVSDLLAGRSGTDGAQRELQQEYGLGDRDIHLYQLAATTEDYAVTPAPSNVGQNQAEIIPYVFPQAVASFLGVDMPTVGVGEAVYPILTSELSVQAPVENAAAAETTGAFTAEVLTPGRLQASFFYSREDRARFAGMDAALRDNLSMGISDGLDKEVLAGTNGLLTGTNLANNAASAVTTFDRYIADLGYGRVDGQYAGMASDLRVVMGAASYGHAGGVYRNTSVDRTALDRLMEITGGVRVSAHVPAAASNKQNALVRRGMRRDMVCAVWEGVTLIPDEITKASTGQIVITAVMLYACKILRTAGFHKQEVQVA